MTSKDFQAAEEFVKKMEESGDTCFQFGEANEEDNFIFYINKKHIKIYGELEIYNNILSSFDLFSRAFISTLEFDDYDEFENIPEHIYKKREFWEKVICERPQKISFVPKNILDEKIISMGLRSPNLEPGHDDLDFWLDLDKKFLVSEHILYISYWEGPWPSRILNDCECKVFPSQKDLVEIIYLLSKNLVGWMYRGVYNHWHDILSSSNFKEKLEYFDLLNNQESRSALNHLRKNIIDYFESEDLLPLYSDEYEDWIKLFNDYGVN